MFDQRLARAARDEKVDDVRTLLDGYLQTIAHTLELGAFTQDPKPDNYGVIGDGSVLLHDLGSITFEKRNVVGALKTDEGQKHMQNSKEGILSMFGTLLSSLRGHPEIDRVIKDFSTRFERFYEPRAVASFGTRKGKPIEGLRIG